MAYDLFENDANSHLSPRYQSKLLRISTIVLIYLFTFFLLAGGTTFLIGMLINRSSMILPPSGTWALKPSTSYKLSRLNRVTVFECTSPLQYADQRTNISIDITRQIHTGSSFHKMYYLNLGSTFLMQNSDPGRCESSNVVYLFTSRRNYKRWRSNWSVDSYYLFENFPCHNPIEYTATKASAVTVHLENQGFRPRWAPFTISLFMNTHNVDGCTRVCEGLTSCKHEAPSGSRMVLQSNNSATVKVKMRVNYDRWPRYLMFGTAFFWTLAVGSISLIIYKYFFRSST
ncbi:hypothetical protein RCL1_002823 [Eukaryota sp. TZLM3-RCL]